MRHYPTWLCTGRVLEHWHSGTMTRRVPQLRNAMPHAYVEMHPEDAAEKGLQNGDIAVIETRRGQVELPVWLNGRSKPAKGSVFVPFFDEQTLINEITLGEVDPISKEPDYKKCAAVVYAKASQITAERLLNQASSTKSWLQIIEAPPIRPTYGRLPSSCSWS